MRGKVYLLIYFCVFLMASCSSTEGINKKQPISCGFDPQYWARSLGRAIKAHKSACATRKSCIRTLRARHGALAGFFNSQARLADTSNCNLQDQRIEVSAFKCGVLSSLLDIGEEDTTQA